MPPALFLVCLAAATGACATTEPSAPPGLHRSFPQYAAQVLQRGSALARTERGFEVIAGERAASGKLSRAGGHVVLPKSGADPVVFTSHKGGEVEVREVALAGEGHIDGRAVTYAVPGGVSYWTATAGGAEEWFVFEPGAVTSGRPAAIWEVAGAMPVQRGAAVTIQLEGGRRALTVTAPAAYLADGSDAPVRLAVRGRHIELYVETRGQAALVDPAWTFVAPMNHPRVGHTARLLTNGTVLVAGGESDFVDIPQVISGLGPPSNTSETYDEVFDEWIEQSTMFNTRADHAMVTQPGSAPPDGAAMVIGGLEDSGFVLFGVEQYDQADGFWSSMPGLSDARAGHTATRLADDRVLVAGGYGECQALAQNGAPPSAVGGSASSIGSGFCYVCSAEVFDPSGGSAAAEAIGGGSSSAWSFTNGLNDCRAYHTETLLPDGRVLITGGESNFGVLNSTEIWSPASGQWSLVAPMLTNREHHTATLLDDGRVLVVGGSSLFGTALTNAEVYDPAADAWTSVPDMPAARTMHAAVKMLDGNVLVTGGRDVNGDAQLTTDTFFPGQGQFVDLADMNDYHAQHTATLLPSGNVLVAGGDDLVGDPPLSAACEVFASAGLPGQPCMGGADCQSTFCVDGVCCDSICDQPCEACTDVARGAVPNSKKGASDVLGSGGGDGFCGPVFQGQDPTDDCASQDPSTCGTIGTCDGNGACEVFNDATICQVPACNGSIAQGGGICNGSGACGVAANVNCDPYACVSGVCQKACIDSTECSAFAFCDGIAHTCAPKKKDGIVAFDPVQCLSGFLADGVCCDTACNSACDTCAKALGGSADGVCTPLNNVQCSDGDACTMVDVCQNGVCVGGSKVVCPGDTGCTGGVACDTKTGQCTVPTPPKNVGDPCDDGSSCTSGEVCKVGGTCAGNPVACTPGECQSAGACVEGQGCQFTDKDNYTACTADDNPCTIDWCIAGSCIANSVADLTACPNGVCIGGVCLPDGVVNPTGGSGGGGSSAGGSGGGGSSAGGSGGGATTGTTGTAGSGAGAANGNEPAYKLVGAGCATSSEQSSSGAGWASGLLALLGLAGLRRRRAR